MCKHIKKNLNMREKLWERIRPVSYRSIFMLWTKVRNYLARYLRTGTKPIWQSGLSRSTYPFPQDCKGRQFELCPSRILPGAGGLPRILPGAGAEGQHPTVGRSKARMGVRLLGRAMLGQTVVAAIICGFVRTDWTGKLLEHIYAPDQGPKLPS